ncbi:tandem-95 repeat protein, partial [Aurantimonas sp. 22II-16-19i]|uniref:tandem-95 repeat protein n=1 Tax=Aurantimonas sp. 22II-16-19i TaxID=1317114 RepID=UPI0009F7A550
ATAEDVAVSGSVAASDVEGDALTYGLADGGEPANGQVTVFADGSYTYTPDADFAGEDSFTVQVSDVDGATDTILVSVAVAGQNDAPTAADGTASGTEDGGAVTIDVASLIGDVETADGDLVVTASVDPQEGSVTVSGTVISFTPAANFNGTADVAYEVRDAGGLVASAVVGVAIAAENDGPAAAADAGFATAEDTALVITAAELLGNDGDVDGDSLTIASVQDAVGGTVALVGGNVVFTPAADATGTASFTYTVEDADGASSTASVFLTITPVNDAPASGTPVTASVDEDTSVTIDVLAGASDPEGDDLSVIAATSDDGQVAIVDNQLVFTPNADFNGIAEIAYTLSDGDRTVSAVATVTVNGVADQAVISGDASGFVGEDGILAPGTATGSLMVDDPDAGEDVFLVQAGQAASYGIWSVGADGDWSYTVDDANADVTAMNDGDVLTDSFTVTSADGTTKTVSVAIYGSNEIIVGTNGNDTLAGTAGRDEVTGLLGDDVIDTFAGADVIFAGGGADTVDAGGGDDIVNGEDAADTLSGGTGEDEVYGGAGNDTIVGSLDGTRDFYDGGSGTDTVDYTATTTSVRVNLGFAYALSDEIGLDRMANIERVVGGADADSLTGGMVSGVTLDGGQGDDTVIGGTGNDVLLGGIGNDAIRGFAGFDRIEGGAGNDTLTGDFNGDTFIFADGFGRDTITDFDEFNQFEKIDLAAVTNITDLADLFANHLTQVGANAVITDGSNTITIVNANIGDLDANDFIF